MHRKSTYSKLAAGGDDTRATLLTNFDADVGFDPSGKAAGGARGIAATAGAPRRRAWIAQGPVQGPLYWRG